MFAPGIHEALGLDGGGLAVVGIGRRRVVIGESPLGQFLLGVSRGKVGAFTMMVEGV